MKGTPNAKTIMAAAAFAVVASPSQADEHCGSRDKILAMMSAKEGKRLKVIGQISDYVALHIWVDQQTGEFALVSIDVQGAACVVNRGVNWTTDNTPPGDEM